jgi:hypothetical protein
MLTNFAKIAKIRISVLISILICTLSYKYVFVYAGLAR